MQKQKCVHTLVNGSITLYVQYAHNKLKPEAHPGCLSLTR